MSIDNLNSPTTPPSTDPNRTVITVVVIAVVGMILMMGLTFGGGWMGFTGWHMGAGTGTSGTVDTAVADAPTQQVQAGDLWFEPETIRIAAGETVNIAVQNDGQIFHDLTIPDLDFQINVEAGDLVSGSLRQVPAGEYEFLCTVAGHASAGMRGTLIVGG